MHVGILFAIMQTNGGGKLKGAGQLIVVLTFVFLFVTILIVYNATEAQKVEIKAVLDRFEGDFAVLLIEHWQEEVVIPKQEMPVGSEENMWFRLEKKQDKYKVIAIDEETSQEKQKIARKLNNRLRH